MSTRSLAVGMTVGLALAATVPNGTAIAQHAGNFSATVVASGTPVELTGFATSFGSRADEGWIQSEIIVTASSPSSVEGTFEYRARETTNGQIVTVEGTFTTKHQGRADKCGRNACSL